MVSFFKNRSLTGSLEHFSYQKYTFFFWFSKPLQFIYARVTSHPISSTSPSKKKKTTWNWSSEMLLPKLKLHFLQIFSRILNPSLDIGVVSDASDSGVGAMISHIFPDGSQKVITHASRSLIPAERNYSRIKKEALTLIYALKKFHEIVYGRHFTLITDHKPLVSIFGSKKGIPAYTVNRLQKWATTLVDHDFSIKYFSINSTCRCFVETH